MRAKLIGLAITATIATAASASATSPPPGTGCVNLKVNTATKQLLNRAYNAGPGPTASGPRPGTTYYGRCGQTYWALAHFTVPGLGDMDGPEAFRRNAGGNWRLINDNGICLMPLQMLKAWNLHRFSYC